MPDIKILFDLKTIEDLKKIKFKPRDLVFNRTLFNTSHAVMFFGVDYNVLVNHFGFKLSDTLMLGLTAAELATMQFNLEMLLDQINEETGLPWFGKESLFMYNFDYQTWRDLLGLRSDHCERMRITKEDATKHWKESASVAISQMKLKSSREYLQTNV
jgi:hypothetical protein